MNKNDQQFIVQKIRTQYMEKESTELDDLRELDAHVKRPANIFAYIFGSIGAVIMGTGMSLVMTDIADIVGISGNTTILGILIGISGMIMTLADYPIYKKVLAGRKNKYGAKILELSEKIMNNN